MTREDIQRSAAQTINDVLKLATGVDVRQRGGFGVQTDISINGGTFDQIAIFLNGVNISNPQTGHNASDFLSHLPTSTMWRLSRAHRRACLAHRRSTAP